MTITLTKEQFERHLDEERAMAIRREPPEVMTVIEVAEYLGLHKDTIYQMVAAGTLPVFRPMRRQGRNLRFLREDVRAWLKRKPVDVK